MVNIFEAKAKLSDLLDRASAGERILICKRNQPVAELLPIRPQRTAPRPIGNAKGLFSVSDQFFQPLDDEDVEAFEGGAPFPPIRTRPSRAAEGELGRAKKGPRTRRPNRA
jgi:prevent-host-death family protein